MSGVKEGASFFSRLLYLIGLSLILWLPIQGLRQDFQSEKEIQQVIQTTNNQGTQETLAQEIEVENTRHDLIDPFSDSQTDTRFMDAVGQIEIPKIGEKLPLFIGADDSHLARGVGQVLGTDLPFKGNGTHCILAGHRGWYGANFFLNINQLEAGDLIYLSYLGKEGYYVVTSSELIDSEATERLSEKDPAIEQVTLLTCHPLFYTWQRLLVHSRALTETERKQLVNRKKAETLSVNVKEIESVVLEETGNFVEVSQIETVIYHFQRVQYLVYWLILGFGFTSGGFTLYQMWKQIRQKIGRKKKGIG